MVELETEFDARIDAEDKESLAVPCPLESCGAKAGETCHTEAGQPRIRHCLRLWEARRENGN
jgi:hypothetical protein